MVKQKDIQVSRGTIGELVPDDMNFNRHTKRGMKMLKKSIRTNRFGRSVLVDKNNRLIAGNGVVEAAGKSRRKTKTIVVETDGSELVVVKRNDIDLDSKQGRELALADNAVASIDLDWDEEMLSEASEKYDIDLGDWGVDLLEDEEETIEKTENQSDDEDEDIPILSDRPQMEILDVLFPSDNDFDIPTLMLERQAGRLELPVTPWGANSRLRNGVSTYHFYVDDYRFEQLFRDPVNLMTSGCKAIVEPNCSLHDQTPIAWGLQLIYKKRWLARYCQEMGIDVYADLNVAPKFAEWNTLGIPKGYNAFFTRGSYASEEIILNDLAIAQRISGQERPNLIVYGGGKSVQRICQEHGLLYVQDYMTAKREKREDG